MELTKEQLEILVDGFRQHDLTKEIALPTEKILSGELKPMYSPLEKRIMEYMKSNFPELGIKRHMENFSVNHPVNMMMGIDARYIANETKEIYEDEERKNAAVEQYMELFSPLFDTATKSYCKAKGKNPLTLNDEDIQRITDRVVTVVNEELTSVLMQGQQFTALNEISHEIPAHADFGNSRNVDAINFHNQWTHCKTAVGAMLSLDDEDNPVDEPPSDDDPVFTVICKAFCETLDDTDATIFHMREDGYTQKEIATYLRYKNHTAVTKRLQSIKKRWDEFMCEHEPQQ